MTETVEAIYKNGNLTLLNPISLNDGQKVKITIEVETKSESNPIIKLAENFYEGLSDADVEEIERVILDRSNFFGGRTP